MEQQANEPKEKDSYGIITYSGSSLPERYEPLVFSRFLRGLRFGNALFRLMDATPYFTNYHRYLQSILERPNTKVRIAALSDDLDNVLGYSIVEGETLHWVHVHKYNRKAGIAKELVGHNIKTISNLTKDGFIIWNKKYKRKWAYNPFA